MSKVQKRHQMFSKKSCSLKISQQSQKNIYAGVPLKKL